MSEKSKVKIIGNERVDGMSEKWKAKTRIKRKFD